jgi:Transcription factor TFIIB repeat
MADMYITECSLPWYSSLDNGLSQTLPSCFTSQTSASSFCTGLLRPPHLPGLQGSEPNNCPIRIGGILCVQDAGWSLAAVLLILGASGGYVLLHSSSYILASTTSSAFPIPKPFANHEGDDPSRVGAASDPLMEGMEQLETIIVFKDGGTGIARELQRAATRFQNSRSERNLLSAFRDISSWCDQFSLPKTISDIAKQLYKRADEEKLLRGKPGKGDRKGGILEDSTPRTTFTIGMTSRTLSCYIYSPVFIILTHLCLALYCFQSYHRVVCASQDCDIKQVSNGNDEAERNAKVSNRQHKSIRIASLARLLYKKDMLDDGSGEAGRLLYCTSYFP